MDAVIVTGAAGALGHAVVDEFLAGGRAVVALDRPSERLDAMGDRENVHAIGVDLASRAAVQEAFTTLLGLPQVRELSLDDEGAARLMAVLVRNAARNMRRRRHR